MKIAIGSDHAGFDTKTALIQHLVKTGHVVHDLGAYDGLPSDYPIFGEKVAIAVSKEQADRGILVCGNGIGMSIVANKFPGVRAALVFNEKMAEQTRSHNDSNVLSLAGRENSTETNIKLTDIWLNTPFSKADRHERRIEEINVIEKNNLKKLG